MKPKLTIDARMLFFSGIGTYLRNFLPYLLEDFSVTLLVLKKDLKEAENRYDAHFIVVDVPIYTIKEQFMLPYKTPSCDLFWSPHYNMPLLGLKARKKIVTIHDLCPLRMKDCFSWSKRMLAYFLLKKAAKSADLVLTVSEFSKREIQRVTGRKNIHVIYNGIEKPKEEKIKKEPAAPFFLYVGNLKPHKNIQRLVSAFRLLPPPYELILAGKNSFVEPSFLQVPRVKVLGEVEKEELEELYKQAKALIQPSLYEGFGLTPLEAMIRECPVISSYAGGLEESCGKAALRIDPLCVKSLYLGMQKILDDEALRRDLIYKGSSQVLKFSNEKSAQSLKKLFQELIL